jgi:hypothetical protein
VPSVPRSLRCEKCPFLGYDESIDTSAQRLKSEAKGGKETKAR